MKVKDVIEQVIGLFQAGDYPVICAYDANDEVDANGVIAVTCKDFENLFHGDLHDYKYNIVIAGQTLADQDKTRSEILQMLEYVMETLENTDFKEAITNCAGGVIKQGQIQSDGNENIFNVELTLYICED